jgi:hypothetical protein
MSSVLEIGKPGSADVGKGVTPVLRDGSVVATLRASSWKEAAGARVGDRSWIFAKEKGALTGRWEQDPEDAVRLRARQTSWWKGTWTVELEGTTVDVETVSRWKTAHRYLSGGRTVAESGTTGGWSPRPTLTTDDSLLLDHLVFLLWLEVVISRRNNAAMTAGVGAAVIGGSS